MSYAQKPTFAEEVQGRVGDAIGRWTFNARLSLKLGIDILRRALFKPRSITILDIPADGDRPRPVRIAVAASGHRVRPDRTGPTPPPLP